MHLLPILLSFLLQMSAPTAPSVNATAISGYWVGENTQDGDGYSSSYEVEMHLVESKGKVSGKTFVKVDDIFAEMKVAGTFENGLMLTLKDVEISDIKIKPGMEWCMKTYVLLLKKQEGEWLLEGHWHGKTSFNTCTPGKVVLRRGVHRA